MKLNEFLESISNFEYVEVKNIIGRQFIIYKWILEIPEVPEEEKYYCEWVSSMNNSIGNIGFVEEETRYSYYIRDGDNRWHFPKKVVEDQIIKGIYYK